MNDEGFRLTPADIRAQQIRRTVYGYDVAGVEDLRERTAEEIEGLLRERAELEGRLRYLEEQLDGYKEREKTLNEAVLMAQQVREDTQQAAKRESELVIRAARANADEMITEARTIETDVRRDIEAAQRQFSSYLAAFRRLLERQLAEVDALAQHETDGSPPGRAE